MTTPTLKELKPLSPAAFFEVKGKLSKLEKNRPFEEGRLSDLSFLSGGQKTLDLSLMWSPFALHLELRARRPLESGDLFELLIDTRDLKSSNVITRFCHHFLYDFDEEEGREVTRFRGEDQHPLADPSLLKIQRDLKRHHFQAHLLIPKELLFGYDPAQFNRLGFCYKFKGKRGEKESFHLSPDHFNLDKHPALWASMEMIS